MRRSRARPFTALNTAFLREGGVVHVAAGVDLAAPVHLLFVTTRGGRRHRRPSAQPDRGRARRAGVGHRELRDAGARADATGPTRSPRWPSAAGAWLEHTRIQRESEQRLPRRAHPRRSAARQPLPLVLAGHGRRAGAAQPARAAQRREHRDPDVRALPHPRRAGGRQPHAPSTTTSPTAGAGRSTRASSTAARAAVFNGKVFVQPEAQKTDAKQTNRNLLLQRRRAGRHQAAARDLRRRREVHPRRHGGPAGRASPSSTPGAAAFRRTAARAAAHLRLRGRGGGRSGARAGARGAGPPGAASAWAAL